MSQQENKFNDSIKKGLARLAQRADEDGTAEVLGNARGGSQGAEEGGSGDGQSVHGERDERDVQADCTCDYGNEPEPCSVHGEEAVSGGEVQQEESEEVKKVHHGTFTIAVVFENPQGEQKVINDPPVVAHGMLTGGLRVVSKETGDEQILEASPQVPMLLQHIQIMQSRLRNELAVRGVLPGLPKGVS